MDGLLESFLVPGAEILGNHDTGTHGQTVEEAHHHEYEASGRCYAGQRLRPQGVAYDQGICSIVQLLEQISQKERTGECDDFLPKASLREVKRACSGAHARSMSQWREIVKEGQLVAEKSPNIVAKPDSGFQMFSAVFLL